MKITNRRITMNFLLYDGHAEVNCDVGNYRTRATTEQVRQWFFKYGMIFVGDMPVVKPMTSAEIKMADPINIAYKIKMYWDAPRDRFQVYASPICNVINLKEEHLQGNSMWFDRREVANYFSATVLRLLHRKYLLNRELFRTGKIMEHLKGVNQYINIKMPDITQIDKEFNKTL